MAREKEVDPRAQYKPDKVLANWRRLVRAIPKMNEKELTEALEVETVGEKRLDFIRRLHRRLNKIRGERELEEHLT